MHVCIKYWRLNRNLDGCYRRNNKQNIYSCNFNFSFILPKVLADTDKKIWDANCNIELSTCHLLLSKERRTGSQKYVGIFKLQRGMNGCLATLQLVLELTLKM